MRFLVDMNLSPRWVAVLEAEGWDSRHWYDVGAGSAPDRDVMAHALRERRIVFTHDLDFGAMLAATQASGPSVVQVRTQDIRPQVLAPRLLPVLRQYGSELEAGALLIVDEVRLRLRLLPLFRKPK
jgi:predicted nuclease of predicted toxin-antitoxin system